MLIRVKGAAGWDASKFGNHAVVEKGAEAGFMSESVRESVIAGQKEANVDTGARTRRRRRVAPKGGRAE